MTSADIKEKLSIFSKKQYIDVFLLLIEDTNNREYIEELIHFGSFLFIYNDMIDINLNANHTFNKFISSKTITIQFQVYSLNFWTAKKSDAKFKYYFWLVSVYVI